MIKFVLETREDLETAYQMYKALEYNEKLKEYAWGRDKFEMEKSERLRTMKKALEVYRQEGTDKDSLDSCLDMLMYYIDCKYTLTEGEKNRILSVTDIDKIVAVVDALMSSQNKENILKLL